MIDETTREIVRRLTRLEQKNDDSRQGETGGWQFIAEQVLTGSVASATFSAIPVDYSFLVLVCEARSDRIAEADTVALRFNADAGNNYDYIFRGGQNGNIFTCTAVIATSSIPIAQIDASNARANNFPGWMTYILGYNDTDRDKWLSTPSSGSFGDVSATSDLRIIDYRGRWRNDSDIVTSINLLPLFGSNFVSGSRFRLYAVL